MAILDNGRSVPKGKESHKDLTSDFANETCIYDHIYIIIESNRSLKRQNDSLWDKIHAMH